MAWIESHQSLMGHPKLLKLELLTATPRVYLVGHLHALWWWALDYAQDGDISQFDLQDLAIAAQWPGDAKVLVDGLLNCGPGDKAGFLEYSAEGQLLIHDWWEYAGKLVAKRKADAERKRLARESKDAASETDTPPGVNRENPEDVPTMSSGRPTDVAGTSGHVPRTAQVPTNQPTEPTQQNQEDQPRPRAGARAAASETTPEVIETAEIIAMAAWVGDELPAIIRQVARSFDLATGFDPRDGPLEAEKYGRAKAYRKKPPDDWYRAWLNWIKRARDDAKAGPVPFRSGNAGREPHNPYKGIEAFEQTMDELEARRR